MVTIHDVNFLTTEASAQSARDNSRFIKENLKYRIFFLDIAMRL